jgi:hypothetical protein
MPLSSLFLTRETYYYVSLDTLQWSGKPSVNRISHLLLFALP